MNRVVVEYVHAAVLHLIGIVLLAPQTVTLNVGGDSRSMLVHPPSRVSAKAPVVFAFHGHGGGSRQASRKFAIQDAWPEAVVVYPQGLPTKGKTDPEGKRSGWQQNPGEYGDRDLAFFDAAYARIAKSYTIDPKAVYAMGHSNGARFTWVLWAKRDDKFAAYGPVCGPAGLWMRNALPASAFVVAGEKDPLVSIVGMRASIQALRRLLGCEGRVETNGHLTIERGKNGLELASYVHPGGHEYPDGVTKLMVDFFKRHRKV